MGLFGDLDTLGGDIVPTKVVIKKKKEITPEPTVTETPKNNSLFGDFGGIGTEAATTSIDIPTEEDLTPKPVVEQEDQLLPGEETIWNTGPIKEVGDAIQWGTDWVTGGVTDAVHGVKDLFTTPQASKGPWTVPDNLLTEEQLAKEKDYQENRKPDYEDMPYKKISGRHGLIPEIGFGYKEPSEETGEGLASVETMAEGDGTYNTTKMLATVGDLRDEWQQRASELQAQGDTEGSKQYLDALDELDRISQEAFGDNSIDFFKEPIESIKKLPKSAVQGLIQMAPMLTKRLGGAFIGSKLGAKIPAKSAGVKSGFSKAGAALGTAVPSMKQGGGEILQTLNEIEKETGQEFSEEAKDKASTIGGALYAAIESAQLGHLLNRAGIDKAIIRDSFGKAMKDMLLDWGKLTAMETGEEALQRAATETATYAVEHSGLDKEYIPTIASAMLEEAQNALPSIALMSGAGAIKGSSLGKTGEYVSQSKEADKELNLVEPNKEDVVPVGEPKLPTVRAIPDADITAERDLSDQNREVLNDVHSKITNLFNKSMYAGYDYTKDPTYTQVVSELASLPQDVVDYYTGYLGSIEQKYYGPTNYTQTLNNDVLTKKEWWRGDVPLNDSKEKEAYAKGTGKKFISSNKGETESVGKDTYEVSDGDNTINITVPDNFTTNDINRYADAKLNEAANGTLELPRDLQKKIDRADYLNRHFPLQQGEEAIRDKLIPNTDKARDLIKSLGSMLSDEEIKTLMSNMNIPFGKSKEGALTNLIRRLYRSDFNTEASSPLKVKRLLRSLQVKPVASSEFRESIINSKTPEELIANIKAAEERGVASETMRADRESPVVQGKLPRTRLLPRFPDIEALVTGLPIQVVKSDGTKPNLKEKRYYKKRFNEIERAINDYRNAGGERGSRAEERANILNKIEALVSDAANNNIEFLKEGKAITSALKDAIGRQYLMDTMKESSVEKWKATSKFDPYFSEDLSAVWDNLTDEEKITADSIKKAIEDNPQIKRLFRQEKIEIPEGAEGELVYKSIADNLQAMRDQKARELKDLIGSEDGEGTLVKRINSTINNIKDIEHLPVGTERNLNSLKHRLKRKYGVDVPKDADATTVLKLLEDVVKGEKGSMPTEGTERLKSLIGISKSLEALLNKSRGLEKEGFGARGGRVESMIDEAEKELTETIGSTKKLGSTKTKEQERVSNIEPYKLPNVLNRLNSVVTSLFSMPRKDIEKLSGDKVQNTAMGKILYEDFVEGYNKNYKTLYNVRDQVDNYNKAYDVDPKEISKSVNDELPKSNYVEIRLEPLKDTGGNQVKTRETAKNIKITPAEQMDIYLLSKSKDGMDALTNPYRKVDGNDFGGVKFASSVNDDPITLTAEDVQKIIDEMPENYRQYADALHSIENGYLQDVGNRASNRIAGINIFQQDNYHHIQREMPKGMNQELEIYNALKRSGSKNPQTVFLAMKYNPTADLSHIVGDDKAALEEAGRLKGRTNKAQSTLVVDDVLNSLATTAKTISRYDAFTEPVNNAELFLNRTEDKFKAYGKNQELENLRNFVGSFEEIKKKKSAFDEVADKVASNLISSTFSYDPTIAGKQLLSIPFAKTYMEEATGTKGPFNRNLIPTIFGDMVNPDRVQQRLSLMKEYVPTLYNRVTGGIYANELSSNPSSKEVQDIAGVDSGSLLDKYKQFATSMIRLADASAINLIVDEAIKRTDTPQEAAKVAQEVVNRTQPTFDKPNATYVKSMDNLPEYVKKAALFTNVPAKVSAMYDDVFTELKQGKDVGKNVRRLGSLLVFGAIMPALANWLRDRIEGREKPMEDYIRTMEDYAMGANVPAKLALSAFRTAVDNFTDIDVGKGYANNMFVPMAADYARRTVESIGDILNNEYTDQFGDKQLDTEGMVESGKDALIKVGDLLGLGTGKLTKNVGRTVGRIDPEFAREEAQKTIDEYSSVDKENLEPEQQAELDRAKKIVSGGLPEELGTREAFARVNPFERFKNLPEDEQASRFLRKVRINPDRTITRRVGPLKTQMRFGKTPIKDTDKLLLTTGLYDIYRKKLLETFYEKLKGLDLEKVYADQRASMEERGLKPTDIEVKAKVADSILKNLISEGTALESAIQDYQVDHDDAGFRIVQ